MVRMQIQLTPAQHRHIKRWAHERGISLAEAIRRCVDDQLVAAQAATPRAVLVREALTAVGRYTDPAGATRVARDHDAHLAEAYRR